jgi:hypothetical protein
MKKNIVAVAVILSGFLLGACGQKTETIKETEKSNVNSSVVVENAGNCKSEAVIIEGYGDKGRRLTNCFVEYPGEPTREDKSYYVVEDICGQFTKEFVGNALGKTITRVKPETISGLYNCTYFLGDTEEYVMLVFEYLKAENQKLAHESMGRKVVAESVIPMRNYVVYQENGLINTIYLILGDNKFISIERSSGSNLTTEQLLSFAANLAKGIKNYK